MTDTSAHRVRRALLIVLARVLAAAVILVVLYYLLPWERLGTLPLALSLSLWVMAFAGATGLAVWRVTRSRNPSVHAIESVASIAVLFVVLFAAGYYVMQIAEPSSFSESPLTRTDTLYFTMTVLSTVGFGDISPSSEVARVVVTVQMLLNFVILGFGVKLLTSAVKFGRAHHASQSDGATLTATRTSGTQGQHHVPREGEVGDDERTER